MKKPDPVKQLAEQKIKRELVDRNSKIREEEINGAIRYKTDLVDCFFCKTTPKLSSHFYDERRKIYIALVICENCGYITEHSLDILVPCTQLKLKLDVEWQ